MKHREITEIINSSFKRIDKYLRQSLVDFDPEAIHRFRTEVKRLRAFLRLLNVASHKKDRLQLSKKIKVIYWYAGNLRNYQLHQKDIQNILENSGILLLQAYPDNVKKQIESLGRVLKTFIYQGDINEEKEKIIRKLPDKFDRANIRKYLNQKVDESQKLLTQIMNDELIHDIRKFLKDILYNWKYIKARKNLLPEGISGKKKIETLTELLGNFCDKSTGINLLETYLISSSNVGDKTVLHQIINKWQEEKNILRSQFYTWLDHNPA